MSKGERNIFILGMIAGAIALSIIVQLFSFVFTSVIDQTSKEFKNRPLFRIELVQK